MGDTYLKPYRDCQALGYRESKRGVLVPAIARASKCWLTRLDKARNDDIEMIVESAPLLLCEMGERLVVG